MSTLNSLQSHLCMPSDSARAFWITGPAHAEIRSVALAPPEADQVRIRTLYSGISRGTETLVFEGRVPESQYDCMRAPFQDGAFPAPVKYGYINVGEVEHGPHDLLGQTVFCLYPHQDRYVVPAQDVVQLPVGLPSARAVLAANMETAVNALWDCPPTLGDRIAVIGAGTLGCLVAWLACQIPGVEVELIDVNPARAAIAATLGIKFAHPDHATPACDAIFHTSATSAGLNRALELAAFEASIVELSWYGDACVAALLGGTFHSRRLKLISSQVGAVAHSRRNHRERMQLALRLLCDPLLDSQVLDALITGEDRFDNLPTVMARLADGSLDSICHRIVY